MNKVVLAFLTTLCVSGSIATAQQKRAFDGVILSSRKKLNQSSVRFISLKRETLSPTAAHYIHTQSDDSAKPYTRSSSLCRRAAIRRIQKAFGGMVRCSPNFEVKTTETPNDQYYHLQYSHQLMSMPYAWDKQKGNSDLLALVIDSGIDVNHPDLKENVWVNPNEIPDNNIDDDQNGFIDDVNGMNAITNIGSGIDDHGHGTHVAGIIGADANNYIGVVGVAHKVKLVSLKFISSTGTGSTANAIKAINYGIQLKIAGHNVVVMNNSYGSTIFSQPFLDAIQRARDSDILFVAAAGNNSADNDSAPFYPANYDSANVISVGSVDSSASYSSFSNYGASSVDVAAPGSAIVSTVLYNTYNYKSGTSMAAPHVAGLAILAKAHCNTLDAISAKAQIMSSVVNYSDLSSKVVSGGVVNGIGLIDTVSQNCTNRTEVPTTIPTQTPTRTATATETPTATPTLTTTNTPTPTATSMPSVTPTVTPKASARFLNSVLVPGRTVALIVKRSPKSRSSIQFQLKFSNNKYHACASMPVKLTNGGRAYRIMLPAKLKLFPKVNVLLRAPGVIASTAHRVRSTSGTTSKIQANMVCTQLNSQLK